MTRSNVHRYREECKIYRIVFQCHVCSRRLINVEVSVVKIVASVMKTYQLVQLQEGY